MSPALLELRRCLNDQQRTAVSLFESAVNMGNHAQRAVDEYLIGELRVGLPLAARHGALAASELAGWTFMHRDFVLVSDRHVSIEVRPVRPGLLTTAVVASDSGPAITWSNGRAVHRSIKEATAAVTP